MPDQRKCRTAVFLALKTAMRSRDYDWSRWPVEWIAYSSIRIPGSEMFKLYGEPVNYRLRLEILLHEVLPDEELTGEACLSFHVEGGPTDGAESRPLWGGRIMFFKVEDLLKNPTEIGKRIGSEVGARANAYGSWIDHALWDVTDEPLTVRSLLA